jgi:hypothetical protein
MRPRALGLVAIGALVTASAGLAACSLLTSYDGFTGESAEDATTADSGPAHDAGAEAALDVFQPTTEDTLCSPTIPPNPEGNDLQNDLSTRTFYGVVSNMRFSAADGGCPLGKNLDGLDTCGDSGPPDSSGPACIPMDPVGPNCDEPGGVDINGQQLLFLPTTLGLSKVDLATELPTDVAAQRTGFVLKLSDYGGQLNDPKVTVNYINDVGIGDAGSGGGTLVEDASIAQQYDWQATGYVNNGVLVAPFPHPLPTHFTFFFTSAPSVQHSIVLTISEATIIGHPVVDTDGGTGLTMTDAQLVGRISSDDIVALLADIFACISYSSAGMLCGSLDLTAHRSTDGQGYGCDALSLGLGFDLTPTVIAGTAAQVPALDYCAGFDAAAPFHGDLCGTSLDAGADAE